MIQSVHADIHTNLIRFLQDTHTIQRSDRSGSGEVLGIVYRDLIEVGVVNVVRYRNLIGVGVVTVMVAAVSDCGSCGCGMRWNGEGEKQRGKTKKGEDEIPGGVTWQHTLTCC